MLVHTLVDRPQENLRCFWLAMRELLFPNLRSCVWNLALTTRDIAWTVTSCNFGKWGPIEEKTVCKPHSIFLYRPYKLEAWGPDQKGSPTGLRQLPDFRWTRRGAQSHPISIPYMLSSYGVNCQQSTYICVIPHHLDFPSLCRQIRYGKYQDMFPSLYIKDPADSTPSPLAKKYFWQIGGNEIFLYMYFTFSLIFKESLDIRCFMRWQEIVPPRWCYSRFTIQAFRQHTSGGYTYAGW